MSLLSDLQAQLADIQAKIAFLQAAPEDTFNVGTIAKFVATGKPAWFYTKTAVNKWRKTDGGPEKELREWILEAKLHGDFEVYELRAQPAPFYATI